MPLHPDDQAIIDQHAGALELEMQKWTIERGNPTPISDSPISDSLRNILKAGYHDLMQTVIDVDQGLRDASIDNVQASYIQTGRATQVVDLVMASDDIRKSHGNLEDKKRMAWNLVGSIIGRVVKTAEAIGLDHAAVEEEFLNLPKGVHIGRNP
jgi:hypothetical protein